MTTNKSLRSYYIEIGTRNHIVPTPELRAYELSVVRLQRHKSPEQKQIETAAGYTGRESQIHQTETQNRIARLVNGNLNLPSETALKPTAGSRLSIQMT